MAVMMCTNVIACLFKCDFESQGFFYQFAGDLRRNYVTPVWAFCLANGVIQRSPVATASLSKHTHTQASSVGFWKSKFNRLTQYNLFTLFNPSLLILLTNYFSKKRRRCLFNVGVMQFVFRRLCYHSVCQIWSAERVTFK